MVAGRHLSPPSERKNTMNTMNTMNTISIRRTFITMLVLSSAISTLALAQDSPAMSKSRNQLKIEAQGICPVMGKPLGSMGTPIKVKIGEEELFLCCEGCRTKQVNRDHWATIHSNFQKAQGQCPVMSKPLPSNAEWTVVEGQIIYICCPPCVDKIKADPKTYLAKLDQLYTSHLAEPEGHDEIRIAVQKICPVMGEPLGSMGTPIKVKVGKQELFLCCEACRTKKIDRNHWAAIHANFAKAQGVCPVMEKPLPANAKWTLVNGQIIYVCCPPCIEKIDAAPEKYTKKLDSLYRNSLQASSASSQSQ